MARPGPGRAARDAVDPSHFVTAFDLHNADGAPLNTDQISLLRALTDGQAAGAEIVISPDGLPATRVLCTGRTLTAPHGHPAGAVVAMTDITAARAAQAALREHAAFHDAVLTASPDLIFMSDPARGQVLWSSHNPTDRLGHTQQQVRERGGDRVALTLHPDVTERLRAADTASRDLENGQALQVRYRVPPLLGQRRDGARLSFSWWSGAGTGRGRRALPRSGRGAAVCVHPGRHGGGVHGAGQVVALQDVAA